MEKKQYICPKCGNTQYESDQFQATGGNFSKIFDIQNKKFITISCTRCGYTENFLTAGYVQADTTSSCSSFTASSISSILIAAKDNTSSPCVFV